MSSHHRFRHSSDTASLPSGPSGPRSRDSRAFTLIELLIAMLIAFIMVGIVGYLFSQTQRGTRISLARTQLALAAQAVNSRLRIDAADMLGPDRGAQPPQHAGGCLVIVPGIREGYVPLSNGQMSKNKVRLRSDQLMFFSKRIDSPWSSVLPAPQNNPAGATTSYEARIWYGAIKDAAYSAGDGSSADSSLQAHLWLMGRQAKLLTGGAGASDCTLDPAADAAPGTLAAVRSTAVATPWTDQNYLDNLIGTGLSAADQKNHVPLAINPYVDLKQLQTGNAAAGLQWSDVANNHLRLFENCSEIVVQWAGDLDKDGQIDTYPTGHPLAGSIIWYPEEIHTNAQKDATTKTRLSGDLLVKYNNIAANPWQNVFSPGFKPALGIWPGGRFGALTTPAPAPTPTWAGRFQFDYGESDNKPNQTTQPGLSIPAPYVFRFDDDQYRLVRYGFRQDGTCYANMWDGKPLQDAQGNIVANAHHWFPYPPTVNTGMTTAFANYYKLAAPGYAVNPPAGPYPIVASAVTPAQPVGTAGLYNFGDLMGATCLPRDIPANFSGTPINTGYRTGPCTASATGLLVQATYTAIPWAPGTSNNFYLSGGAMTLSLGGNAAGTESLWPYYSNGNLVALRQVDGSVLASLAKPLGDATYDTVTPPNPPAGTANPAPPGTPPAPSPSAATQSGSMAQQFGPGNNFTVTYTDLWAEYLKVINDPAKANTREDWRNPQSDWPRLIRIRVRLHDAQGLVSSYSDEFLVNGRDNDGDGVVNNPEEGRMSGMWIEYILAVPYPTDPTPRNH